MRLELSIKQFVHFIYTDLEYNPLSINYIDMSLFIFERVLHVTAVLRLSQTDWRCIAGCVCCTSASQINSVYCPIWSSMTLFIICLLTFFFFTFKWCSLLFLRFLPNVVIDFVNWPWFFFLFLMKRCDKLMKRKSKGNGDWCKRVTV